MRSMVEEVIAIKYVAVNVVKTPMARVSFGCVPPSHGIWLRVQPWRALRPRGFHLLLPLNRQNTRVTADVSAEAFTAPSDSRVFAHAGRALEAYPVQCWVTAVSAPCLR